jgi:hypothetical protein
MTAFFYVADYLKLVFATFALGKALFTSVAAIVFDSQGNCEINPLRRIVTVTPDKNNTRVSLSEEKI